MGLSVAAIFLCFLCSEKFLDLGVASRRSLLVTSTEKGILMRIVSLKQELSLRWGRGRSRRLKTGWFDLSNNPALCNISILFCSLCKFFALFSISICFFSSLCFSRRFLGPFSPLVEARAAFSSSLFLFLPESF